MTRRLRVAYVDHTAQLSGGELALANLLPALTDVEPVVVVAQDGPLVERLRDDGVRVEVLPLDAGTARLGRERVRLGALGPDVVATTARYVARLARRLRELDVDVVHAYSLKSGVYGSVAGRLARRRVVWTVQDRIAEDYLPRQAVALVRGLLRVLPHAVIANSATTAATLGTAATVAFPPVPTPTGHPASGPRPFTAGMIGRLTSWKGQHVFLEAFARAFPGGDAQARIVGAALFGEHEYERRLHADVERLGLTGRVHFTGFRADIGAELAGIDVAVHCSTLPEPFGQVVVEAMAAGVAVVAAAAGGPAEIVTDGVDGLLTPPGDPSALADALRRLAGDEALRGRLADAGRRRARDFSPAASAAAVSAVYRDVVGGRCSAHR